MENKLQKPDHRQYFTEREYITALDGYIDELEAIIDRQAPTDAEIDAMFPYYRGAIISASTVRNHNNMADAKREGAKALRDRMEGRG